MSSRLQVLEIYRRLLRTAGNVFGEDIFTTTQAKQAIRQEFEANRSAQGDGNLRNLLDVAVKTEQVLRNGVIQGRLNSRGNYDLRIPSDFSKIEGTTGLITPEILSELQATTKCMK